MGAFNIVFPIDLDATKVVELFNGIAADLPAIGNSEPLVLVARSSKGVLSHTLIGSSSQIRRIRSVMPNIRLEEIDGRTGIEPNVVVEMRITNRHRPLRSDLADSTSSAILGALSAARFHEQLEMRWLLRGARGQAPARQHRPQQDGPATRLLLPSPSTWHQSSEAVRAEVSKQSEANFQGTLRIAARSVDVERSRQLIRGVIRALATTSAPGVRLQIRLLPQFWLSPRYIADAAPRFEWPILINSAELTSLLGWPVGSPRIPGLELGSSQLLPPARTLSRSDKAGAVIAEPNFPGSPAPIVIKDADRLMHGLVLGPTGSGKSVLLGHVAASDVNRGHALVLVDPKGDLVDYVADHVPKHRLSDVIYFDPSDPAPVGYNPLSLYGQPPHLIVDQIDHIFSQLFGGNYGPRSGDINRAALLTLMTASGADAYTLTELPTLLTSVPFRRKLLARIDDPGLLEFWRWYEALGTAQSSTIAPLMNKLRALLLRDPIRNVLGQAHPGWTMTDVIAGRKILLLRLSPGEIGAESAQLLGSLLIAGLWQAVQARSSLPSGQRRPTMLIVDEWQNYIRIPTGIGDMLAQARGLGLGITLANQALGQLTPQLQSDVLANARSKVVFQTSAQDARTLAPHLPGLRPEDLQHLGAFEVFAQLAVGSNVAPVVSGMTRPPETSGNSISKLRAMSRKKYGMPVDELLSAMAKRVSPPTPTTGDQLGEVDLENSNRRTS